MFVNNFKMIQCGNNVFDSLIISSSGKCYYLRLHLPNFPTLQNANLETSWNLRELLIKENEAIFNNIETFHSTNELLAAIKNIVNQEKRPTTRSPNFYSFVFKELNEIGPTAEIHPSLLNVEFKQPDLSGRIHKSCVTLPPNYPDSPIAITEHELPISNASGLGATSDFSGIRTLKHFYQQFNNLIEVFQQFWDTMDNFDANCCVIEPQKPRLSDCYRRIQLTPTCTALLTVNPYNARQRPAIEFRGPDQEVTALRNTLESHLIENHWDPEVDIHLNLLSLLDLEKFASQDAVDEFALVQVGDCGICFDELLEGQHATQRCDNPLCKSQYHQVCLLKYLSSSLNLVRVMNIVMGRCPTCKCMIGCPQQ